MKQTSRKKAESHEDVISEGEIRREALVSWSSSYEVSCIELLLLIFWDLFILYIYIYLSYFPYEL